MSTLSLWLKSQLIGTSVEELAKHVRWLGEGRHRAKYPELQELYLEEKRLPIILGRLLKPSSCAIDVGAHIGSYLSLLIHYAPNGRHIAVEPSPTKAKWLRKRFAGVLIIEAALSDENGHALFQEEAQSGYSHLTDHGDANSYKVRTHRLDDLPIERVDLLKLDIEGGELKALRGAQELIRRWRPAILFECGHEYPPLRTDRRGVFGFVTDTLDYKVYTFTDFLFEKGALSYDEFRKCGLYPFRAFNYLALPR